MNMKNNIKFLVESYFDSDKADLLQDEIEINDVEKTQDRLSLKKLVDTINSCDDSTEDDLKNKALPILQDIYDKNKELFTSGNITLIPKVIYGLFGNKCWSLTLGCMQTGIYRVEEWDYRKNKPVYKRKKQTRYHTFCAFWENGSTLIPGQEEMEYHWSEDNTNLFYNIQKIFNLEYESPNMFKITIK